MASESKNLDQMMKELLMHLYDLQKYGYQPMYNGRPSCPFCGNFVDNDESHEVNCVLLYLEEIFDFGGEKYKNPYFL